MSTPEIGQTTTDGRNERLDAELRMVRLLEEMIRVPHDYQTHIIDPRHFPIVNENIPAGLGIAPKGKISGVASEAELDECTVIIRPTINEQGKLGIIETSAPNKVISPELGASIDRLSVSVKGLNNLTAMFYK